ncbi:hypothetical protein NDU88_003896 [Pleurodeles waltl]|uniref:Uncharacterized protein n=1 Tax=Pleurodeles waltl TaxID=8319 RepID=A0AAV7QB07_PLEWA|nr:hypothetical protein NDU88_003896 [Pleurodeles waltl]
MSCMLSFLSFGFSIIDSRKELLSEAPRQEGGEDWQRELEKTNMHLREQFAAWRAELQRQWFKITRMETSRKALSWIRRTAESDWCEEPSESDKNTMPKSSHPKKQADSVAPNAMTLAGRDRRQVPWFGACAVRR